MLYLILNGLILFRKGEYRHVRCRMILKLAAHQFWMDPYLKSTTVLFDSAK